MPPTSEIESILEPQVDSTSRPTPKPNRESSRVRDQRCYRRALAISLAILGGILFGGMIALS